MSETQMTQDEEEGLISSFAKKRGALVNLVLLALAISGAVLFIILYLLFWIIDMDLRGDPEPVWAQAMWFAPQLGLVLLLFQTIIYPMRKNPIQSPAVYAIVAALVSMVFDIVVSVFYFRLFWQCFTGIGTLKPLEDDICHDHKPELYTIAWFNFVFFWHALASAIFCAWAYTKDLRRISDLKEKLNSGTGAIARGLSGIVGKIPGKQKVESSIMAAFGSKNKDDKKFARIIGSMFSASPNTWNAQKTEDLSLYSDARSTTTPSRRRGGVTRMDAFV